MALVRCDCSSDIYIFKVIYLGEGTWDLSNGQSFDRPGTFTKEQNLFQLWFGTKG